MVDSSPVAPHPATALTLAGVALGGLMCRRSYEAFDTVVEAVESSTVGVVEAIGEQTTKVVPVVIGIAITLMLVFTNVMVQKYWVSRKDKMKKYGESPEGNAESLKDAESKMVAAARPYLYWLTHDMISLHVRNLADARSLVSEDCVRRHADSLVFFNFQVESQTTGSKRYTVRLKKEAVNSDFKFEDLRTVISCGCPGNSVTLAQTGDICKHAGSVLLSCFYAHSKVGTPGAPLRHTVAPRARSPPSQRSKNVRNRAIAIRDGESHCAFAHRARKVPLAIEPPPSTASGSGEGLPLQQTQGRPTTVTLPTERAEEEDEDPWLKMPKEGELAWTTGLRNDGDVRTSGPGRAPAAVAVAPGEDSVFSGYDEGAEEAAKLLRNGGTVVSMLGGKETHKMVVFLLGKARVYAYLTAFTFDLLLITEALKAAAERGVRVEVFADRGHAMRGATQQMMERLDDLRKKGVEVFLTGGVSPGGIQHSKTLYTDGYYIVGSTNWTTSSRSNHESSVLVKLTGEGIAAVERKLDYVRVGCTMLTAEVVAESRRQREGQAEARRRAQSTEPNERFATARRFSIARARSREAALASSEATG